MVVDVMPRCHLDEPHLFRVAGGVVAAGRHWDNLILRPVNDGDGCGRWGRK